MRVAKNHTRVTFDINMSLRAFLSQPMAPEIDSGFSAAMRVAELEKRVAALEDRLRTIDAGLSQRQAAKVLGVDESTVRADLRENPAENAEESRTPADADRAQKREDNQP